MTEPRVRTPSVLEETDLHYVWTRDFEPAKYCSPYILATEKPAVIDTGTGANWETILDALTELGIEPEMLSAIILTHVHLDHAGGAGYLADACPNADIFVHHRGATHLVDPERLWEGTTAAVGEQIQNYATPHPIPTDRIVELDAGDRIDLGDRELLVHPAPGHAFHQVVYEDLSGGGVFTGDAAGIKTPGVDRVQPSSPPPDFDLEASLEDIEMIESLSASVLYLGHFGPQGPEKVLEEYRTVLSDWVEAVAEKRDAVGADEAVAYFAEQTETGGAWGALKAREEARMNVRGVLTFLGESQS
ncbi:MBL fold metallo-hydrolase [Halodesulfurarchaeum sp.]|uniref:MBL fold metallo-hydrolase n=1 Tax=Halodesulfurarchaeum sp. TaxID=1980530 RepID=UPI002FC30017